MNEYFSIGKIAASFGLQGEVVLKHSLGNKTTLKGLEVIFFEELKNSFIPYFIESISVKNEEEVLLKFVDIQTKEATKKIISKKAWLSKSDFEKFASKTSPIALLGFNMIENNQQLGEIIEVIEQPMQVLCKIMYKNVEALIPLHEETLVSINQKKKEVHVTLPEGLLDVFS